MATMKWGSDAFCAQKGFENFAPFCKNGKATDPTKDWSGYTGPSTGYAGSGGNYALKVPVHLRSLSGVLLVGVIALVANEVNPQVGLALAFLLFLDVGLTIFAGSNGLFDKLGGGLAAGGVSASGTTIA